MTDIVLILSTVPTDERGEALARTLVEERLVACVNLCAASTSVYRWKGRVERDQEQLLVMKTRRTLIEAVRERLHQLHPYDLPEFVVVAVEAASAAYLAWVSAETRSPGIEGTPPPSAAGTR